MLALLGTVAADVREVKAELRAATLANQRLKNDLAALSWERGAEEEGTGERAQVLTLLPLPMSSATDSFRTTSCGARGSAARCVAGGFAGGDGWRRRWLARGGTAMTQVPNRDARVWHGGDREWPFNDGLTPNSRDVRVFVSNRLPSCRGESAGVA